MAARKNNSTAEPLIRVAGLSQSYVQRRFARPSHVVQALSEINLAIPRGCVLALVGESGSGKSTLARCLACLERPSAGEIWFEGRNLTAAADRELQAVRPRLQLIFQDAATALNPRFAAWEIVAEPLVVQRQGTPAERRARALELMEQVGLPARWAERRPAEFSGGQRQRLAIARALTLRPSLLILDEALSGLDLSIQAQIVNLLLDIQERHALTYLYIAHDLSLVRRVADEVAVLQRGRIVEQAATAELFAHPRHGHTQALLAAIPGSGSGPMEASVG